MPFVWDVGGGGSMPGLIEPGGDAPAIASGANWDQEPWLDIRANGSSVPHVLDADIVYGLDVAPATATIKLTDDPGLGNNTEIEVWAGAGTNNIIRMSGLYKRRRATSWEPNFTMHVYGKMQRVIEYQQAKGIGIPTFVNQRLPVTGLTVAQLVDGAPQNDQNIILGVLNNIPGVTVDPADIGGTGRLMGRLSWRDLAWRPYEKALPYIQKIDSVCLGYRLYETMAGRLVRSQIFGYPSTISDYVFTEGLDIFESEGERSIVELINGMYVEGYPLGGVAGLLYALVQESNDFQPSSEPHIGQFNSPLIDGINGNSAYINPLDVANWKLTEGNRELVNVSYTTFRDDALFPGRSVAVNFPKAAVTEPTWLQRVEITVRSDPILWQQRVYGYGGGQSSTATWTPPEPF